MGRFKHHLPVLIVSLLLLVCFVIDTVAQSDADDIPTLSLLIEISQRGIERFGCWTSTSATCRWDPPLDYELPILYYEIRASGRSWFGRVDIEHVVTADSVVTWWPEWADTLTAQVRAVSRSGAGDWSDPVILVISEGE